MPDETDAFERIDRLQTLVPVITALTPRERAILVMRFVRGCTQAEIGAELGVSQMQVSRLLRDLLERLREALAAPEGEDEAALVID